MGLLVDLGQLTSLQVLGCDEATLVAYTGIDRFGIHLDDLAGVVDTSDPQVWCRVAFPRRPPVKQDVPGMCALSSMTNIQRLCMPHLKDQDSGCNQAKS